METHDGLGIDRTCDLENFPDPELSDWAPSDEDRQALLQVARWIPRCTRPLLEAQAEGRLAFAVFRGWARIHEGCQTVDLHTFLRVVCSFGYRLIWPKGKTGLHFAGLALQSDSLVFAVLRCGEGAVWEA